MSYEFENIKQIQENFGAMLKRYIPLSEYEPPKTTNLTIIGARNFFLEAFPLRDYFEDKCKALEITCIDGDGAQTTKARVMHEAYAMSSGSEPVKNILFYPHNLLYIGPNFRGHKKFDIVVVRNPDMHTDNNWASILGGSFGDTGIGEVMTPGGLFIGTTTSERDIDALETATWRPKFKIRIKRKNEYRTLDDEGYSWDNYVLLSHAPK